MWQAWELHEQEVLCLNSSIESDTVQVKSWFAQEATSCPQKSDDTSISSAIEFLSTFNLDYFLFEQSAQRILCI